MSENLSKLAFELLDRGYSIGTIEQCTCGLVGASIASVCSLPTIYKGSVVPFNNDRLRLLSNLQQSIIDTNGLYSAQVAMQMAFNGSYMLDVDLCIGVVGDAFIREDSSIGKIWICVCKKHNGKISFKYAQVESFHRRSKNIENAIEAALAATLELIRGE